MRLRHGLRDALPHPDNGGFGKLGRFQSKRNASRIKLVQNIAGNHLDGDCRAEALGNVSGLRRR